MRVLTISLVIATVAAPNASDAREKLSDDPTKVITWVGARYADFLTVSDSIAFGPVTKINTSYSENNDWSIGGSYLFRFGIVNVSAARTTLSNSVSGSAIRLA